MRYLLLTTLLFSCLAFTDLSIAQEKKARVKSTASQPLASAKTEETVTGGDGSDATPTGKHFVEQNPDFDFATARTNDSDDAATLKQVRPPIPILGQPKSLISELGACCLQNGRCRDAPTKNQCDSWRGEYHSGEACPVDCQ